nr:MAG TPA: hypothetical protein [Caudoviricetes sp.]
MLQMYIYSKDRIKLIYPVLHRLGCKFIHLF